MTLTSFSPNKMTFVLTVSKGLESVLQRELEKLGITPSATFDGRIECEGDARMMARLNLNVRTANRVYVLLAQYEAIDFDELYDGLYDVDWAKWCPTDAETIFHAFSDRSKLTHLPTIQKISKKAYVDNKVGRGGFLKEDPRKEPIHITLYVEKDNVSVLLDSSGEPLHKRGYRKTAGEAPIKETLAAGLVDLSGWRFGEMFFDPFCGSGTFLIEAAMMARNIAPGSNRSFACETFPWFEASIMAEVREEALAKVYPSGKYRLVGSDIDPEMVRIARECVELAGLSEDITISEASFPQGAKDLPENGCFVTNPPYGERLGEKGDELDAIYVSLLDFFRQHGGWTGGIITSYPILDRARDGEYISLKTRRLMSGGLPVSWYGKLRGNPSDSREGGKKPGFGGSRPSGGGSRPGGARGGFGGRSEGRSFGSDSRPSGGRSFGDRPAYGDRSSSGRGANVERGEYGERRDQGNRFGNDGLRPAREERPFRDSERPSREERPARQDRPSYGDRPQRDFDRPARQDRPSRDFDRPRNGDRPERVDPDAFWKRPRKEEERTPPGMKPKRESTGGPLRSFNGLKGRTRKPAKPSSGE